MNNKIEFLEILKKANVGDPEFTKIIGNIRSFDLKKIVNEDIVKYVNETSQLSYSAYFLGFMYDEGEGVKQNYQKAIELYEKAIELENSNAMNNLALMYDEGEGVEQNYPKAIKLYEKAIELGNSNAMNNLALMYDKGKGVEQNYPKAIELYEKAIELGNNRAMFNLALKYYLGEGVEQNYPKAIELYEKAIELGNSSAMNNLGYMYQRGEGVEQNYPKAMELYKKAIELGNANSMNNLGCMYQNAYGTEQNYPKAIELYEKAIELENTIAMDNLIYLLKEQDMLIELAELYLKYGKKEQFTETINKIFSKTDYKHDNTKLINLVTKDNIEDNLDKKIIYPALLYLINYLNIHLKYSMSGEGFIESHEHFTSLCNNNSKKIDF